MISPPTCLLFFFFNDTATTEIYTLSLHDALPIFPALRNIRRWILLENSFPTISNLTEIRDRKSTRLNSSHQIISYAVFCLKKKNILLIEHLRLHDDDQQKSSADATRHGTLRQRGL